MTKKIQLFSVDDLFYAVEDEDFSLVKKVILSGINPDIENKYGDRALYEAAKICNDKILNFLIDHCAEVNFVNDEYNKTVLWYSVFGDNINAVEKLLKKGADLDIAPLCGIYSGITPLHLALRSSNIDIAKTLIRAGADLNDAKKTQTILDLAVEKNLPCVVKEMFKHSEINEEKQSILFLKACSELGLFDEVKKLLEQGIDPNASLDEQVSISPLYCAIRYNRTEVALFLIEGGANVNFIDSFNNPLLRFAIREDNEIIVKTLLLKGADPNIVLGEAINKGSIEIIKMLLNSSKIDRSSQPLIFDQALDIIKSQKSSTQISQIIKDSEDQENSDNESKLDWEYDPEGAYAKEYYFHQAVKDWNLDLVKMWIDNNIVDSQDYLDKRPIHVLFNEFAKKDYDDEYSTDFVDILKLLIENGANINIPDPCEELLPLEAAIEYGYTSAAKLLIKAGAEYDKDNRLMFENAIKNGNSSLLKLALKHFNVNINSKIKISKKQEYTPLKLSVLKGNQKIVKIMLAQNELDITEQGISILSAASAVGWLNKVRQIVESLAIDDESIIDAIEYSTLRDFSFNVTEYLLRNYSGDKAMLKYSLYWSVTNDNAKALLLLKDGCEINYLYKNSRTLLHQAVLANASVQIFEILIDSKISINATDDSGKTALHLLAISRPDDFLSIAELLIKHKVNLDIIDYEKGYTSLMYASSKKNLELVKLLLESGSKSELISKNQDSIFHISLLEKYFVNDRLVEYLSNTLDISVLKKKNLEAQTILHVLTEYNSSIISGGERGEDNILTLVKQGISIYLLDKNFTSPLSNIVKGLIGRYRYHVEEHERNLDSKLVEVVFKNHEFNIEYLRHLESILNKENMVAIINIIDQINGVEEFDKSNDCIIEINKLIERISYDAFNDEHIQRLLTHSLLNLIEEEEKFESIYEISNHSTKLDILYSLNIKNNELQKLKEGIEKLYVEKTLLSEIKAQVEQHDISVLELKQFIENSTSTIDSLNISTKVKNLYDSETDKLYQQLEELSIREAGVISEKNAISPAPWHHFIKMIIGSDYYSGNDDVNSLDKILRNNQVIIKRLSDNNKYYWQISYLTEGGGLVYMPYKLSQIEASTIDFYQRHPNYINPGQFLAFLEEGIEEINMKRKYTTFRENGSINQEINMPLKISPSIVTEDLRRAINISDYLPEQICEDIQLDGDYSSVSECDYLVL